MIPIDFNKDKSGLVPAIIQDNDTQVVLMMGYMNAEAYEQTLQTELVTFYSRSKKRLWVKGEESGNLLKLKSVLADCDGDTLLIRASPTGPVCHTGTDTCWQQINRFDYGFVTELETIIKTRKKNRTEQSYISSLFDKGINKIAQKVGEEAVELVIEAKDNNNLLFLNEGADLFFHFLILLQAKNNSFEDVVKVLRERHEEKN